MLILMEDTTTIRMRYIFNPRPNIQTLTIFLYKFGQPSHHIPYLYSLAGASSKTQERVRQIAVTDYNDTVDGLAGVRHSRLLLQFSF